MLDFQLSVQVDEPFQVEEALLRRAVAEALAAEGVSSRVELSLVITDDQTVQGLNQTYRGLDEATDVLAFAFSEAEASAAEPFVAPPDGVLHLGEVVISYPIALRQAEEQRHPLERELALLVIHGVLHLLGYDHEQAEDEQKMRAMEAKVLAALGGS